MEQTSHEPQPQPNDASTSNKMIKKEKKRRKKKKRPPHKSKMVTGYIIYASEIRKDIIKKYPNREFGDISKIVGVEWKNLPQETKIAFEKRAQEQNAKSKLAAAEALALKKLADAAEERANLELLAKQQVLPTSINNNNVDINNSCNGGYRMIDGNLIKNWSDNHSSSPLSPNIPQISNIQQMQLQQRQQTPQIISKTAINNNQQPFQIIQQQQQPIGTTVQYCNNYSNNSYNPQIQIQVHSQNQQQTSINLPYPSQSPQLTPIQYQRNNIVYKKPATVRLRPKDAITQTDPIVWLKQEPKKPLRFSEKFIDYLKTRNSSLLCNK